MISYFDSSRNCALFYASRYGQISNLWKSTEPTKWQYGMYTQKYYNLNENNTCGWVAFCFYTYVRAFGVHLLHLVFFSSCAHFVGHLIAIDKMVYRLVFQCAHVRVCLCAQCGMFVHYMGVCTTICVIGWNIRKTCVAHKQLELVCYWKR